MLDRHARTELLINHGQYQGQPTCCGTHSANIEDKGMLTAAEKSAYIKAELCLMAAPSKLRVPGAVTRWDDLHWNHIVQAHVMHDVVSITTSSVRWIDS